MKPLVIYLLIYQKHVIVSTMNFPLQSLINTVSAYQHSNQFMIILIGNKQQESTFSFSEWLEFDLRVTQRRILGVLLFNIFLIDLFLIMEDIDITSYAHNNTPYVSEDNVDEVIDPLEQAANTLLRWF